LITQAGQKEIWTVIYPRPIFLQRILNEKRPRYLCKINTMKQKKKLDFFQLFEYLEIYNERIIENNQSN
jgi:hypothetical protein